MTYVPPDHQQMASDSRKEVLRARQATVDSALDHARRAVELDHQLQRFKIEEEFDTAYEYAKKAITAYWQSVEVLQSVIDEIQAEIDLEECPPEGRGKWGDEVEAGKRLKEGRHEDVLRMGAIRQKYQDRMKILSRIYGISGNRTSSSPSVSLQIPALQGRKVGGKANGSYARHGVIEMVVKNGRLYI